MTHNELRELAHDKSLKAQRLIDTIEYLYGLNRIDDDRKYEMFQEVRSLQEQAQLHEKQALAEEAEYWRKEYAAGECAHVLPEQSCRYCMPKPTEVIPY